MGIEEWGALELAGVTIVWWVALFVGVLLYARWRARQAVTRPTATAVANPLADESAAGRPSEPRITATFEERINVLLVALYMIGPPLVLVLIRFLF